MNRKLLWVCFLVVGFQLGCAGAYTPQPEAPLDADRSEDTSADSLETHLDRLVPFGFSGAVLVLEQGRTVHAGAYGFADQATRRLNTTDTIFDVGSLSKQFTAAAILSLAEAGRLSVADEIGVHLPGVPEDKRGISIHQLLTHTAGLPEYHDTGGGDFEIMTRDEAERHILNAELEFSPGEDWAYSNAGYTLLAAIVERVAGKPYETVLREKLFDPSGLERTGLYFQLSRDEAPVARGYRGAVDQGSPLEWTETEELWALIGGGGILSTIGDLQRWDQALRDGTVLSNDSRQLLMAPHVEVREGLHYGYGWYVDEGGPLGMVIRHGGANDFGFAARWRRHEQQDLLVLILVNREPPGMDAGFAADTVVGVVESVVMNGEPQTPPKAAGSAASMDLERYGGTFRFDDGSEFVVGTTIDALIVEPRGAEAVSHLAFPAAGRAELESIRRLDEQAEEVVRGIMRGDYQPLARFMPDPSRVGAYQNYISNWWSETQEAGADPRGLAVLGTVPSWWSHGDDRLATLIGATAKNRARVFRIHWREGQVAGLGGGAIREPVTTLFMPTESGRFLGYHLGIRHPVEMSFETASNGQINALHVHTRAGTATAKRLKE